MPLIYKTAGELINKTAGSLTFRRLGYTITGSSGFSNTTNIQVDDWTTIAAQYGIPAGYFDITTDSSITGAIFSSRFGIDYLDYGDLSGSADDVLSATWAFFQVYYWNGSSYILHSSIYSPTNGIGNYRRSFEISFSDSTPRNMFRIYYIPAAGAEGYGTGSVVVNYLGISGV